MSTELQMQTSWHSVQWTINIKLIRHNKEYMHNKYKSKVASNIPQTAPNIMFVKK